MGTTLGQVALYGAKTLAKDVSPTLVSLGVILTFL